MMKIFDDGLAETEENERLYQQELLILDVTEQICEIMEKADISKAALAERLLVSRPYITRLLGGTANMTLRTLSDIGHALGEKVCVTIGKDSPNNGWATAEGVVVPKSFPLMVAANDSWRPGDWHESRLVG